MHSREKNNNVIKDSQSSVYHLYSKLPVLIIEFYGSIHFRLSHLNFFIAFRI